MSIERAVQLFAVIHLSIIGMSHVFASRAWAEFFLWLRSREHAGVFVVGFMSLGFGSIIAAFHPVWSGVPLILTLYGWAQVLKALVYFVFPQLGLKKLHIVSIERHRMLVYVGFLLCALAGLLAWHVIAGGAAVALSA